MNPYKPPTPETIPEANAPAVYPGLCRIYLLGSVLYFLVIAGASGWHTARPDSAVAWHMVLIVHTAFSLIHGIFLIAFVRKMRLQSLWLTVAAQLALDVLLFFEEPFGHSLRYDVASALLDVLLAYFYLRAGSFFPRRTPLRRLALITLVGALLNPALRYFEPRSSSGTDPIQPVFLILLLGSFILIIWDFKLRFSIFWRLPDNTEKPQEN
ncbi:MAG: hypothetical protein JNM27_03285 [Leptospirales bacterium]|nr:hypothetical protein [Leptospirales bacterium]